MAKLKDLYFIHLANLKVSAGQVLGVLDDLESGLYYVPIFKTLHPYSHKEGFMVRVFVTTEIGSSDPFDQEYPPIQPEWEIQIRFMYIGEDESEKHEKIFSSNEELSAWGVELMVDEQVDHAYFESMNNMWIIIAQEIEQKLIDLSKGSKSFF